MGRLGSALEMKLELVLAAQIIGETSCEESACELAVQVAWFWRR
jgi:hypothetical protein